MFLIVGGELNVNKIIVFSYIKSGTINVTSLYLHLQLNPHPNNTTKIYLVYSAQFYLQGNISKSDIS